MSQQVVEDREVTVKLCSTTLSTVRKTSPLIYFCESSPRGLDHGNQE